MDPKKPRYHLPDGTTVEVWPTAAAAEQLALAIETFRTGNAEPLVFGEAGSPDAVVIPFAAWRALVEAATDEDGFDTSYSLARHRLQNSSGPSVPLEDVAEEYGWDLDDETDDSEFRKPQ